MSVKRAMGLEETIAKIILIVITVIGGVLLTLKQVKLEKSGQKYFLLGIAVFAYVFALTRAIFVYTDNLGSSHPDYQFLWRLGWVMSLIAIIAIVVVIETYMVKTRYVFTVIGIIGVILTIILEQELLRFVNAGVSGVLLVDLVAAYVYVIIKSEGAPRIKATKSLLGIALLAGGLIIDGFSTQLFSGMDMSLLGVSLMVVGLVLYFVTLYRD